jgi:hypothetical protein
MDFSSIANLAGPVMQLMGGNNASDAAAKQSAQAAGQAQALNRSEYNVGQGENASGRALGGLAQSRLSYLMGLSSNLDISRTQLTPQILDNNQVVYTDSSGKTYDQNMRPVSVNTTNNAPRNASGGMKGAISGAATGASAGAAIGSVVPGIGTAIGGAVGAIGGGLVGLFSKHRSSPGGPSTTVTPMDGPAYQYGGNPNEMFGAGGTGTGGPSQFGAFSKPFTANELTIDPGYNFRKSQGELGLQKELAASGHAVSGSALKDALSYSSGLASEEFNNAFNRNQTQNVNQYNMLQGAINSGQGAINAANASTSNANTNMQNTIAGNAAVQTGVELRKGNNLDAAIPQIAQGVSSLFSPNSPGLQVGQKPSYIPGK